jgi:hypothetical protein
LARLAEAEEAEEALTASEAEATDLRRKLEEAEQQRDTLKAALEAQSPVVASYIAEQSGEGKPASVLGDWLRLVAKERHRAESAERKLEEAELERDAMVCGLSAVVHCQSSLTRSSMRNAAADILERVGRKPVDFGGDQSPFVVRAEIAERKLEEARKALEPFEELADEGNDDQPDDTKVIVHAGRSTIYTLRLADLRAARAVYRAIEGSAQ